MTGLNRAEVLDPSALTLSVGCLRGAAVRDSVIKSTADPQSPRLGWAVVRVLRGPAKAQEARAAMGHPAAAD